MDGYGKRVLIVDDDEHTRRLIGILLEQAGCYNVVLVPDGLDALYEVKKRHFDAVITDYSMPILNGQQLLGRIHAIRPEIPVILVSAHFPEYPSKVNEAPFFACLRKPFDKTILLELLRTAVHMPEPTYAGHTPSTTER